MSERINTEVLIIGSGISGLLAALELSKKYSVTILSKSNLNDCSTAWAQGGIAAVINNNDHINNHVEDTLNAIKNRLGKLLDRVKIVLIYWYIMVLILI